MIFFIFLVETMYVLLSQKLYNVKTGRVSVSRLELELQRDKQERDERERELRERQLRELEFREKMKQEIEMKPPGKLSGFVSVVQLALFGHMEVLCEIFHVLLRKGSFRISGESVSGALLLSPRPE